MHIYFNYLGGIIINEKKHDQSLRIKTTIPGEIPTQSLHYNHYEATPYRILANLFDVYDLKKSDGFVDFGSGKGRIMFYVHNRFHCSVTGVEMNEQLYQMALVNLANYTRKVRKKSGAIRIECCFAEKYEIAITENRFYFFNPFSVQIFRKVVDNIQLSVERHEREVELILYYPVADYVEYLEANPSFELHQEVRVPGLYNINKNERFLIYRFVSLKD